MVSAWTGLSKPPKTKALSRYSEGILVRGLPTRCHHCCQALGEGQQVHCWHTPHSPALTLGRTSEEFRSRKSRRSKRKKPQIGDKKNENKRRGENRKIRTKPQISCSKRQKAKEIMQRGRCCLIINGIFTGLRKRAVKSKAQETGCSI